jgi:hypothetical protein
MTLRLDHREVTPSSSAAMARNLARTSPAEIIGVKVEFHGVVVSGTT